MHNVLHLRFAVVLEMYLMQTNFIIYFFNVYYKDFAEIIDSAYYFLHISFAFFITWLRHLCRIGTSKSSGFPFPLAIL